MFVSSFVKKKDRRKSLEKNNMIKYFLLILNSVVPVNLKTYYKKSCITIFNLK